jgi:hypothetical protein
MHEWFTSSYDPDGEACKKTFAISRFDFPRAILLQGAMRAKNIASCSTKPIALTIVSDDPDLRKELAFTLRTAGYGVSTLGSTEVSADEGSQATIYTGDTLGRHSTRRRFGRRFKTNLQVGHLLAGTADRVQYALICLAFHGTLDRNRYTLAAAEACIVQAPPVKSASQKQRSANQ